MSDTEQLEALARAVLNARWKYGRSHGISSDCGICGADSRSRIKHYRDCPVPLAHQIVAGIEARVDEKT